MFSRLVTLLESVKRRRVSVQFERVMAEYKINRPKPIIDGLHKKLMPLVRHFAARGLDDITNHVFFTSFFVKAQKEADQASFDAWLHDFSGMIVESARRYQKPIPVWQNDVPRLAFIGLGDDPSAYEHVYHLCRYLKQQGAYQPSLFLFGAPENLTKITAHFGAIDVPVIAVDFHEGTIPACCLAMRDALWRAQIDITVWVHLPTIMLCLYGMRVARTQIHLAQYLHPDTAQFGIAGLTFGSIAAKDHVFLRDTWRVIPSALQITTKESLDSLALRRQFGDDDTVILATFGRIEKIRQPAFLNAVSTILLRNPNTVYLYTGYEDDAAVAQHFAAKGLGGRVTFVGWVDIDVYAHMIDMILDSFPLATGITALKAMAYGKPVLSMGDDYSYMGRDIRTIIESNSFTGLQAAQGVYTAIKSKAVALDFLPYADDEKGYSARATLLINVPDKRAELVAFQLFCIEQLYTNTDLMGALFVEQISEIKSCHE